MLRLLHLFLETHSFFDCSTSGRSWTLSQTSSCSQSISSSSSNWRIFESSPRPFFLSFTHCWFIFSTCFESTLFFPQAVHSQHCLLCPCPSWILFTIYAAQPWSSWSCFRTFPSIILKTTGLCGLEPILPTPPCLPLSILASHASSRGNGDRLI